MKLMRVVCWLILVEMMKRVMVRHKREDDERVRKRVEVHQDNVVVVVVVVEDDCQMCQKRCCQYIMAIMVHDYLN